MPQTNMAGAIGLGALGTTTVLAASVKSWVFCLVSTAACTTGSTGSDAAIAVTGGAVVGIGFGVGVGVGFRFASWEAWLATASRIAASNALAL